MASFQNNQLGFDPLPAAVTGLSWKAQLAQKIFSETGDTKLKESGWFLGGEHGWDTGVIDKLVFHSVRELAPGADRLLAMSANVKVTKETARSFMKNYPLYVTKPTTKNVLGIAGKIASQASEAFGNIAEGAGGTGKALPWLVGALVVGVAGYVLFAGSKGVNLIPSFKLSTKG